MGLYIMKSGTNTLRNRKEVCGGIDFVCFGEVLSPCYKASPSRVSCPGLGVIDRRYIPRLYKPQIDDQSRLLQGSQVLCIVVINLSEVSQHGRRRSQINTCRTCWGIHVYEINISLKITFSQLVNPVWLCHCVSYDLST